jgi:hypothetical protein
LQTEADVQECGFTSGPFGLILKKAFFSQFSSGPLERVANEAPEHKIGDLQRALLEFTALERQRMPEFRI